MYTTINRAQNVFSFATTVASVLAACIAVSTLLLPQHPSGTLSLRDVQVAKGRPHYYSTKREEYAHIKFDLDADLSSLFNWNTKQVFVWVMASYPSRNASEPPSQAIVWDAILASPSEPWHQNQYVHPRIKATSSGSSVKSGKGSSSSSSSSKPGLGILRLRGQKPKYQITDVKGRLAGRGNATLELKYNVQPWVGPLLWSGGRSVGLWKALTGGLSDVFHFPDLKTKATDTGTAKGGERNRGKPA